MEYAGRKRKSEEPHSQPPKKFHKGNTYTQRPPSSHGLPPLPDIDAKYQEIVFIHPSQVPYDPQGSYDRLEFLGDAYLEIYASQLIFERFQHEVGKLSQIRETLVKNETIGQYASLYGLDKRLKNYKQFQNGPAHLWLKIKGDIFESYVAAVVLSTPDGTDVAKRWLSQLWEPKLLAAAASTPTVSKQTKEELAKKLLMKGVKVNYVDEKPPIIHYGQGKEEYFVGVYFDGLGWENQFLGSGKALSRGEAGHLAAAEALRNPLVQQIAAKRADVLAERNRDRETTEENGLEKE